MIVETPVRADNIKKKPPLIIHVLDSENINGEELREVHFTNKMRLFLVFSQNDR